MAKAGDLVLIGKDICLLFRDNKNELCNIILVNAWTPSNVAIQGGVAGKGLANHKTICSLTDILNKIMTNE